jgi:hypothetical protein
VAGLRLDTGGWIRPVSDIAGRALTESQYTTMSGHSPSPLDTIKVPFSTQIPKYNQPENWKISGDDWELLTTDLDRKQKLSLNTAIQRRGPVICDHRSSIPKHEITDGFIPRSLTVLSPDSTAFYIRRKENKLQPRAAFVFDGIEYDLPITDTDWRNRVDSGIDTLPSSDDVDNSKTVLFTISLGEENDGRCYKIVAGIFTVGSNNLADI